ncbi:MAG: NAD-dependent epimerase/dehydratase family protein [Rhizomicrobium sp.]
MRIFVAGATGIIGRPLVKLLVASGHDVTGSTRTPAKAHELEKLGATPVVVDVFDADGLRKAVVGARPEIVIHQLTDLPDVADPDKMGAALQANARLRVEGTFNLVVATKAAGARRLIAQSISFLYAPGKPPYRETDPLVPLGPKSSVSARGVHALEGAVLGTPWINGIVLRYGRLYGPGTWAEKPTGPGFVHTDAAAHAALLAVTRGAPGAYNIAEDDGDVVIDKARKELGFDPAFRLTA